MSDADLLQSYVREQSDTAFATLVQRHVDLVYSTALRQLRSSVLAEEVAQSVFIDLARRASRLRTTEPLAPWLYVVARRTAIDLGRRDKRRQAHEAAADEIDALRNASSASWAQIEGLVDEAMQKLSEAERAAIVLRFFQNLPLRDLGATLGISDDAAQKRVSRALDQLHDHLLRRGVGVTAAGLASDLSAHALVSAPAGLGLTLSTTAVIAAHATATASATLLTTTQKSVFTTAFALVLGAGVYEATVFARQSGDLRALQQQADFLSGQLEKTRGQQASSARYRETVEREISIQLVARSEGDSSLEARIRAQLAKVDQLKQLARDNPQLCVPEMGLLTEEEWFDTAQNSNGEPRRQFVMLREMAGQRMAEKIRGALALYLQRNNRVLPDHVSQLLPFFDPPIESEWLARYAMNQTGPLEPGSAPRTPAGIVSLQTTPVDIELDHVWSIGPDSVSSNSAPSFNFFVALTAFERANPTRPLAVTPALLLPYLKWPMTEDQVRRHMGPSGIINLR